MLRGRSFLPTDTRDGPRVAIINQVLAELAWPGEDPVGRTVDFGLDIQSYLVVGVVATTKTDLVTDNESPQVFSLLAQDFSPSVYVTVRQSRPDPDFPAVVRGEILAVDRSLALGATQSLESLAGLGMLPFRLAGGVAMSLGILALFLSALGVYGVVAFTVAQRTPEIGVRIALGSTREQVLTGVLKRGLRLAGPGLILGAALAVGLGFLLRSALLGVEPLDPVAYLMVALLLGLVVVIATLAPALRASRIQPVEALRYD